MKNGLTFGGLTLAGVLLFISADPAMANGLTVTHMSVIHQNTAAKTADVRFDLSWSNSWRAASLTYTNWDAAWVFVKFRPQGSNAWEHARLSSSADDHVAPGGVVDVGSDGTNGIGVFIYSPSPRVGDVTYAKTRLRWTYGSNGYSFAKGAVIEISVHAIEMVYVQQGPFYVGSGGTETGHFYQYTDGTQSTNPFLISAENSVVPVGTANGDLNYVAGTYSGDRAGPIPAAFPKGYNAYYCMKYEITQGQYVDFLNKLTRTQQNTRTSSQTAGNFALTATATINSRNGIRCPAVIPASPESIVFGCDGNANMIFNEFDDARDRVCNYLTWANVMAYADWAGLRPMTELEFEKACRGPIAPLPNEWAWGNATARKVTGCVGTDGSGTETPSPANANYLITGGVPGPARAGIFATLNSTREAAGASYWGILELSGNVYERAVSVGTSAGRTFTGLSGDGILDSNGNADTTALKWPGSENGVSFRGSSFIDSSDVAKVSNRNYGFGAQPTWILPGSGGRVVRTAP